MDRPLKLKNAVQPYAWGSFTAIADLLGQASPADQPQAELWMGAHPRASSRVWFQGRWQSLHDLIQAEPAAFLGQLAVDRFGAQLPFLFKVLAVEQPLSIQAHPDGAMAQAGFQRENCQQIPLSAPHRNYRDPQHKPECVCALTPFVALCGFRSPGVIRDLLAPVWPGQRMDELALLPVAGPDQGIEAFFVHLLAQPRKMRADLLTRLAAAARAAGLADKDPAYDWMLRLSEAYPGDAGILGPVMLNLITLQPGQALFLPPRRLHAYLHGVAIEVMANSDNVLRGGLTPKHVDIDELLKVVEFQSSALEILEPRNGQAAVRRYTSQADEFELAAIRVGGANRYDSGLRAATPEIWLCTDGQAVCRWEGSEKGVTLNRGESMMVPAALSRFSLTGEAFFFRAGIHPRLAGGTAR